MQMSSEVNDPMDQQSRVYFDVAFAKKEQARRLGAKWDVARGAWYAPGGIDRSELARLQVFTERSFATSR